MRTRLLTAATCGLTLWLAACGGDGSGGHDRAALEPADESPPTVPVAANRDGRVYRQQITAPTGDRVVFQVFEPATLEVGRSYPLVLHGHGYGGSRQTARSGFVERLSDAGYYVISIDQRGFGESGGTVRVMSPDFEGRNLVAILDWAEALEGLRRRGNGEMFVGSYGGSYGGMYQLLLHAVDPRHRLRVLAPDIAPHDLVHSLFPNEVIKSGWGLALVGAGELPLISLATGGDPAVIVPALLDLAGRGTLRQDPVIFETLVGASLTNELPESGRSFFAYHSFRFFCDGEPAGPQSFTFGTADPRAVPPNAPPAADVLLTQGFLDTLFDVNDGLANYECLKGLGGDVRLLTHQSGHILPLSLSTAGLEDPLDPFYAALTIPEFQDAGATRRCGSIDLDDAQLAWFEEKLRGRAGAIDAVLRSGRNVCVSLAEGDAIEVESLKRGGTSFTIDASTPQLNSGLGVLGALLGTEAREALLATQPLFTAGASGAILAGLPALDVEIEGLSGVESPTCVTAPIALGCDPILFLAIGQRPPGQTRWEIVDDQLTPIRGFGRHALDMTAIAERLVPGEELALLVYGFHAQYPVTWSRDLFVPAVTLRGEVELPLLGASDLVRDGL
jgi:ABC-2 type transport system ATP-binding protein